MLLLLVKITGLAKCLRNLIPQSARPTAARFFLDNYLTQSIFIKS